MRKLGGGIIEDVGGGPGDLWNELRRRPLPLDTGLRIDSRIFRRFPAERCRFSKLLGRFREPLWCLVLFDWFLEERLL